jgi:hypothetical protein
MFLVAFEQGRHRSDPSPSARAAIFSVTIRLASASAFCAALRYAQTAKPYDRSLPALGLSRQSESAFHGPRGLDINRGRPFVLTHPSSFQAINQGFLAKGLTQERDCPRC